MMMGMEQSARGSGNGPIEAKALGEKMVHSTERSEYPMPGWNPLTRMARSLGFFEREREPTVAGDSSRRKVGSSVG